MIKEIISYFFKILFLPLQCWFYLYFKLRSTPNLSHIEILLEEELSEKPKAKNFLQNLIKPQEPTFYSLMFKLITLYEYFSQKKYSKKTDAPKILLRINHIKIGWSRAWELHSMMDRFKKLNIEIHTFLESGDLLSYYIALGGSYIYIPPALNLDLFSKDIPLTFYHNLLSKQSIKANFVSIGKYKSAVEKYTQNKASSYSKQQLKDYLKQLDKELSESFLKRSQQVNQKKLEWNTLKEKSPYTAQSALQLQLVDGVLYYSHLQKSLIHHNQKAFSLSKAINIIEYKSKTLLLYRKKKKLAFITGEGVIVDDLKSSNDIINFKDYAKALKTIKKNKYDSLVLRWNSPGGSALTSDLLWNEIMSFQEDTHYQYKEDSFLSIPIFKSKKEKPLKEKKQKNASSKKTPVLNAKKRWVKNHTLIYISQSDVAASGGYYLSAVHPKNVFCTPLTITGSIGVLTGKFNFNLFLKKWGITTDTITTSKNSDFYSMFHNFSAEQKKHLENNIKDMYELFLHRIATGRSLKKSHVRKLAEGRVYSGELAHKHQLTDHLGGLFEIITQIKKDLKFTSKDILSIDVFPKIKSSIFKKPKLPILSVLAPLFTLFKAHSKKDHHYFLDIDLL